MIAIVAGAALVVVSGCGLRTARTYSGETLDDSEVAILTAVRDERFFSGFSRWSYANADEPTDFKVVGNEWIGYPDKLKMLPGTYLVMMYCSVGDYYAFPSMLIEVREGATYDVSCGYVKGELGKIELVAVESSGA